jgi:hypothetical protein
VAVGTPASAGGQHVVIRPDDEPSCICRSLASLRSNAVAALMHPAASRGPNLLPKHFSHHATDTLGPLAAWQGPRDIIAVAPWVKTGNLGGV